MSESCATLCASSLQHFAAIGGGHSLAEAVLLLALPLLGLVCSEHCCFNSFVFTCTPLFFHCGSIARMQVYKHAGKI